MQKRNEIDQRVRGYIIDDIKDHLLFLDEIQRRQAILKQKTTELFRRVELLAIKIQALKRQE